MARHLAALFILIAISIIPAAKADGLNDAIKSYSWFRKPGVEQLTNAPSSPIIAKAKSILLDVINGKVIWEPQLEKQKYWPVWARGAVTIPLRSGQNPIVALFNPFSNQAVFLLLDNQHHVQKYGYYNFGDTVFDGVKALPYMKLDAVYDNFHSIQLRMESAIEKGQEELFFRETPAQNDLIPTIPIVDAAAEKIEHASMLQADIKNHPFIQTIFDKKINVVEIFNRQTANKKTLSTLSHLYGLSPISLTNIPIVWQVKDRNVIEAVFYDPFLEPALFLLFSYTEDNPDSALIDATCFTGDCAPDRL